jgi:hypothetical protein
MYERLKQAVNEYGEVMIQTDSGEEHELHKHNSEFLDDSGLVKVDADDRIHWLNLEKVERYWIHKEF